ESKNDSQDFAHGTFLANAHPPRKQIQRADLPRRNFVKTGASQRRVERASREPNSKRRTGVSPVPISKSSLVLESSTFSVRCWMFVVRDACSRVAQASRLSPSPISASNEIPSLAGAGEGGAAGC